MGTGIKIHAELEQLNAAIIVPFVGMGIKKRRKKR